MAYYHRYLACQGDGDPIFHETWQTQRSTLQPSGPIVISSYKPQNLRLSSLVYDMEAIIPADLHKLAIKLARISGISGGATNGAILSWRLQMVALTSLVFSKAIQHAIGLIRWEPLLGRDLYAHTWCHLAWYQKDHLKLKRKGGAYFLGATIANANMGDISQGN